MKYPVAMAPYLMLDAQGAASRSPFTQATRSGQRGHGEYDDAGFFIIGGTVWSNGACSEGHVAY